MKYIAVIFQTVLDMFMFMFYTFMSALFVHWGAPLHIALIPVFFGILAKNMFDLEEYNNYFDQKTNEL